MEWEHMKLHFYKSVNMTQTVNWYVALKSLEDLQLSCENWIDIITKFTEVTFGEVCLLLTRSPDFYSIDMSTALTLLTALTRNHRKFSLRYADDSLQSEQIKELHY